MLPNRSHFLSHAVALFATFVLLLLTFSASAQTVADEPQLDTPLWTYVAKTAVLARGPQHNEMVTNYQTVAVDQAALRTTLAKAPLEFSKQATKTAVTLPLPLPDGTLLSFAIVESPIMEAELAARYPDIKTYSGYSLDNPAIKTRLDWSPSGLNAIILTPDNTYLVQPYQVGDSQHHITYNYADLIRPVFDEGELEESPEFKAFKQRVSAQQPAPYATGSTLRLYRIAVAATGEFAQTYGSGTVSGTLAAIVTRLNQVNATYERDLAVRVVLIAETDQVIYLNGATDPYTNNNLDAMLSENPTNLNNVIGADKFDIGHVFAESGGGGKAQLGSVCGSGKAVGASGSGADFYILAHELGHQFGAGHVQNTNNASCNRAATSAWEPGSGVTIMSYNGICDSLGPSTQNFNVGSFQQMRAFIDDGNGNSCGYDVPLANTAPVVDAGSTGFSIPINTPFALVGTATDAEGDTLGYSWEQHDLGAAAAVGSQPAGETVPLVRVDPPKETGVRFIPRTAVVAAGLPDPDNAELLPAIARSLTFRLHVHDNHAGIGGVAYDEISFNAVDTGATFQVTSPNSGAETWTPGNSETVTWNVANTDQAPISCSQVNIDLSVDGGQSYPHNLATNTPNDGSQSITVPTIPTTLFARVRVACSELPDHFFYDISDNSFTSGTINTTCAANVVTNISDSGPCTLRQHVADATAGDTITFDNSIAGQTIYLLTAIDIAKNLTIDGTGQNMTISGDGDNNGEGDSRIFNITDGHTILRELTLTKGRANRGGLITIDYWDDLSIYNSTLSDGVATDDYGGAIYSLQATVNIYNSSFVNNEAGSGGGLFIAFETANIYNSTFSNNRARWWDGGGINGVHWSSTPSTVNLFNSTFSDNYAAQDGGGVYIDGSSTLNMANTLIVGSTNGGDCVIGTAPTTNTNNWVEDGGCSAANSGDPLVGSLGFNGGTTETHPLLAGSGAINAGDTTACSNANLNGQDQRGYSHNGTCDIGAFEYDGTEAYGSNDAPTIANQAFTVDEASAPGTVVDTVSASDSDALSFSIVGGNSNNTFSINSSTGQISVQSNGSLTAGTVFNLGVKVLDDGTPNLASFATVTVTVNDVNLAPTINDQAFTVSSSAANVGDLVGTAVSTDPDNDTLSFAINAGNTGNAFTINSLTGDITVATPAALTNAPFNLTVQVTDDGSPTQNDTATITVNATACPTASVVTSTADSGPCTLRQAIADASAGDTITFDAAIAGQTIRLATELLIDKEINIDGSGQNITISGDTNNDSAADTRLFNVNGGHLILREMTLTKGTTTGNGGLITIDYFDSLTVYDSTLSDGYANSYGGAIYSLQGNVNIYNSSIINNEAGGGGGLFIAFRTANIYNSTFSNNHARWWDGGGVNGIHWSSTPSTINLFNSTFFNNQAAGDGGGVYIDGSSTLNMTNTLIGGSTGGGDCVIGTSISTNVNNWVQDGGCSAGSSGDPLVAALANNGGPTQTHALQAGSGAINSGNAAACATAEIDERDQRGYMRNDAQCDIGAFEYGAVSATAVWDGGGTTNNWSEAANWVGDVVPVAANDVVFNITSSKNGIVDASFSGTIKSLTLAAGYTGEVSLARSLTVSGAVAIADGATLNLDGQTLTTEAVVTNKGVIEDRRAATAVSTTVPFATIKNAAGTVIQYYGLDITPTGGSMGNVTVAIGGNQSRCTLSGSDPVLTRCFEITPDTQTAATIRYYYEEPERNQQFANVLNIWHDNGSSWEKVGSNHSYSETDLVCINNNQRGCWVEVENISSYSPFVLGGNIAPTTPLLNLSAPTLSISFVTNTLTISWGTEANSCNETNVYTTTGSPYGTYDKTASNVSGNAWDASGTDGNAAINTFYYLEEIHCATGASFETNKVGEFDFAIVPGS